MVDLQLLDNLRSVNISVDKRVEDKEYCIHFHFEDNHEPSLAQLTAIQVLFDVECDLIYLDPETDEDSLRIQGYIIVKYPEEGKQ